MSDNIPMLIPDDAYISTYYGVGICNVCGEEKELRLGWCFDCFEKAGGCK